MAKRSVTINLINNTPYYLVHYWEAVCHGSWGPVNGTPTPGPSSGAWTLPEVIAPNSTTSWSSADADFSIATGTEAWAKYSILCQPPLAGANLLYIYWNNPYVWTSSANSDYIDFCVIASEGTFNGGPYANLPNGAPCQQQSSQWPEGSPGSVTPGGLTGPYGVTAGQDLSSIAVGCQLAPVSATGSGPQPIDDGSGVAEAWNWFVGWPEIVEQSIEAAETDINLSHTFVLREPGSVAQSVDHIYDPKKGLRALAVKNKQPSLRQLFAF
jgi:hypothetical protein